MLSVRSDLGEGDNGDVKFDRRFDNDSLMPTLGGLSVSNADPH